ncbi:MAG: hypothetical protein ACYTE5_07735 [Planctomycetota bacterium]
MAEQPIEHVIELAKPYLHDYDKITHLRTEAKEKMSTFRPHTLAQAFRIGGITPADITVIQIHLRKYH